MSEYALDRPGAIDADRETRGELVARARELVPLLARNAEKTEQDRRVVEENITALRDAGLFKLTLPKRFGRYETDIRTLMEVTRELARGCGSTAWVTWFVAGMRGTGSNTLVANDVFVPEHHIAYPGRQLGGDFDTEHKDEARYRSSLVAFAVLSITGPQLGLAVAALELVLDKAPKRAISYSHHQTQVGGDARRWRPSAGLSGRCRHRPAALDGALPDHHTRARIHADVTAALVHSCEAIRVLVSAHGAAAFGDANPLQRMWRDAEVASRHGFTNPSIANEVYGRSLLGIQEWVTAFV